MAPTVGVSLSDEQRVRIAASARKWLYPLGDGPSEPAVTSPEQLPSMELQFFAYPSGQSPREESRGLEWLTAQRAKHGLRHENLNEKNWDLLLAEVALLNFDLYNILSNAELSAVEEAIMALLQQSVPEFQAEYPAIPLLQFVKPSYYLNKQVIASHILGIARSDCSSRNPKVIPDDTLVARLRRATKQELVDAGTLLSLRARRKAHGKGHDALGEQGAACPAGARRSSDPRQFDDNS